MKSEQWGRRAVLRTIGGLAGGVMLGGAIPTQGAAASAQMPANADAFIQPFAAPTPIWLSPHGAYPIAWQALDTPRNAREREWAYGYYCVDLRGAPLSFSVFDTIALWLRQSGGLADFSHVRALVHPREQATLSMLLMRSWDTARPVNRIYSPGAHGTIHAYTPNLPLLAKTQEARTDDESEIRFVREIWAAQQPGIAYVWNNTPNDTRFDRGSAALKPVSRRHDPAKTATENANQLRDKQRRTVVIINIGTLDDKRKRGDDESW